VPEGHGGCARLPKGREVRRGVDGSAVPWMP
jgi:hypothetical protein